MASQYVQVKQAGTESSPTEILNDSTGRAIVRFFAKAAGHVYDKATGALKYNANGTIRTLVDLSLTQTLTNKTLSAPAITSAVLTTPSGVVVAQEALFTEVTGNKTHTASFTIPAGATILDIWITNVAVWNSGTSATLIAGISGGDTDCFYTALNVKTTPAAGKSINFSNPGGANGASVPAIDGGTAGTQLGATSGFLYSATAQQVDVTITDVNVSGTAGRTRVTVLYSLPSTVIAPVVV